MRVPDEPQAEEKHRDRQKLAHGRAEPEEAEERVRRAEEFDEDARGRVAHQKGSGERAGPLANSRKTQEREEQKEQHDAFEPGLIKLARMARLGPAVRKDHRPGHIARPAPQLRSEEHTSELQSLAYLV